MTLFFLLLSACSVRVLNTAGFDCEPAYEEPCDRGITCETCIDNFTGETFWSCSDGWSASEEDTGVDIAAEVACRCWLDHLADSHCEQE